MRIWFVGILLILFTIGENVFADRPSATAQDRHRCEIILRILQQKVGFRRQDTDFIRQEVADALPEIAFELWRRELETGDIYPPAYIESALTSRAIGILRKYYRVTDHHRILAAARKHRVHPSVRRFLHLTSVRAIAKDIISRVTEEEQTLIRLHIGEGLSFFQMSEVLQQEMGTLKSKWFRMTTRFRRDPAYQTVEDFFEPSEFIAGPNAALPIDPAEGAWSNLVRAMEDGEP